MLSVFRSFCTCIFSVLKFEDGQFLSVPSWALDVKSWRDTKRVEVPANAVSFQCRNGEHA